MYQQQDTGIAVLMCCFF